MQSHDFFLHACVTLWILGIGCRVPLAADDLIS